MGSLEWPAFLCCLDRVSAFPRTADLCSQTQAPPCSSLGRAAHLHVVGGLTYLLHGDLQKRISTYWWPRTRITVPLLGEVFDISGLTTCSVFRGTSLALHTDSLVMIHSLKHQSPDNSNYKVCILLLTLQVYKRVDS